MYLFEWIIFNYLRLNILLEEVTYGSIILLGKILFKLRDLVIYFFKF